MRTNVGLKRALGVLVMFVIGMGLMPARSAFADALNAMIKTDSAPATVAPGESVSLMTISFRCEVTSDTVTQVTVKYTGDSPADVTSISLRDTGGSILQSVLVTGGQAVFNLSVPLPAYTWTDPYSVTAELSAGATAGHTLALSVEPGGMLFQQRGAVPFVNDPFRTVKIKNNGQPIPVSLGFSQFPLVNKRYQTGVSITGTAPLNSAVNLAVSDAGAVHTITRTLTPNGVGDWVTMVDLSSFNDGPLSASAYMNPDMSDRVFASSSKDTLVPNPPDLTTVSSAVNSANQTAMVIDGIVEVASVVQLTIVSDRGGTTVADSKPADSGTFSFRKDVRGLSDGTLTYTLTATDPNGNKSAERSGTVAKDTEVNPNLVLLDNGNATLSNYRHWPVNGWAELGAQIAISVDNAIPGGPVPVTASMQADYQGQYSFMLDVSSLDDGVLTLSVTQTDKAGNTATVTKAAVKDISPPGTLSILSFPPWVDDNNKTAVPISGTRAYTSDTVTVVITDGAFPVHSASATTINYDGLNWSATVNVAGLDDGVITATVQAWDAAGNRSRSTSTQTLMTTDFPPAPTEVAFGPVNNALQAAAPISGKAPAQIKVDIVVTDTAGHRAWRNVLSDSGGNWSTTVDVSGLVDGPITASVTTRNAKEHGSLPATINSIKDTVAPAAPLAIAFMQVTHTTQGTAKLTGVAEAGGIVTVTVTSSGGGAPVTNTTTADGGSRFDCSLDLSGLGDGVLTVQFSVADAAGNRSNVATVTDTRDTVAPTISSASVAYHNGASVNTNYQHYAWNRPAKVSATASEPATWTWTVKDPFGNTVATSNTDFATAAVSFDWAPAKYAASGNYTVTFSATDLALNPALAPMTLTIPVYNYDFRITGTRIRDISMVATAVVTAGIDYYVEVTVENLNNTADTPRVVFQQRQGAVQAFDTAPVEVAGTSTAVRIFTWRPTYGSKEIDFFVWNEVAPAGREARSGDFHMAITVN